MPVGPSHNRSSRGSSRSSGGGFSGRSFSSGGFSFGGASRRNRNHTHIHRAPLRMSFFGRNIIVPVGRQSWIAVVVMFLIFAIFGVVMTANLRAPIHENISSYKADIAQIELDAEWYASAKQKAEAGTDDKFFIAYAEYNGVQRYYYNSNNPTGYYYDEYDDVRLNNTPYFYLIYRYEVPVDTDGDGLFDSYEWLEGETYSEFSSSQAAGWNRKIIVGYDNGSWASINYDYSLSSNEEYLFLKQQLNLEEDSIKSVNKAFGISIAVLVLLVIALVVIIVFAIKKGKIEYEKEQEKKDAEIEKEKAEAKLAEDKASQINRKCLYCGSSVPDGDDCCPSCGARKFK